MTPQVEVANPVAESLVLGACLVDQDAIVFVSDVTSPKDFHVPANRWMAEAIWECLSHREPPTLGAVITRLQAMGRWSDRTAPDKICRTDLDNAILAVSDGDIEHAVTNAKQVREAAFRRNGKRLLNKLSESFSDLKLSPDDVQKHVTESIGKIFDGNGERDSSLAAIGEEEEQRIESMADGELPGVTCGLAWLDELTSGFLPGETWIIAGAYKQRKTTAMLNMILAAAQAGAGITIFTNGDSSRASTYRKLLSMMMNQAMIGESDEYPSTVSSTTLQYRIKDERYAFLKQICMDKLHQLPIRLKDGKDGVGDLRECTRILRRDVALHGTRIFVYDFAQAINYGANDYDRTTYFSSWIQNMAGETGTTGIGISQVNEQTIVGGEDSYSPGAKGGGALPAAANIFLVTSYQKPLLTVKLKLARDAQMGSKVSHTVNPASGLILDSHLVLGK